MLYNHEGILYIGVLVEKCFATESLKWSILAQSDFDFQEIKCLYIKKVNPFTLAHLRVNGSYIVQSAG